MHTHTDIQVSNGGTIDLPSALVLYSEPCVLFKEGEHQRVDAVFAGVGATASKLLCLHLEYSKCYEIIIMCLYLRLSSRCGHLFSIYTFKRCTMHHFYGL